MTESPKRIVSGRAFDEDVRLDASVRPKRMSDFIGQARVKENILIAIEAARSRGDSLDHVLLYGPPGLGKTQVASGRWLMMSFISGTVTLPAIVRSYFRAIKARITVERLREIVYSMPSR